MPSVWISALKEYNDKKGMWCLPKKGSAEHAEVMKIMDRMRGSKAEPAVAKEKPKRKLKASKSESDSDVPVAKPKVRAEPVVKAVPVAVAKKAKAEPKAKAPKKGTVVPKDKFVPQLRTAQEKQDYLEQRQLELMTEDFKKGLPLKLREKK